MSEARVRRAVKPARVRPKASQTPDFARQATLEAESEAPLEGAMDARRVLQLQRLIGNQHVVGLLNGPHASGMLTFPVQRAVAAPPAPAGPQEASKPLTLPAPHTSAVTSAPPATHGATPEVEVNVPGGEGGAKAGGAGGGGGGGGGGELDGPPIIGETVAEIAEPGAPAVGAIGAVSHAAKPATGGAAAGAPPSAIPAAPQAPGFESAAAGIEGAANKQDGGLLDTLVQAGLKLLQSITSGLAGSARNTATAVGGQAADTSNKVTGDAGNEGQAATTDAQNAAKTATTEAGAHVTGAHQAAGGAVRQAVGQAQQAPSQVGGALSGLVKQVLAGAPAVATLMKPYNSLFGGIFGALPGRLKGALNVAQTAIDATLATASAAINAASQRISAAIAKAGAVVEGALAFVAGQTAALREAADRRLDSLPSIARSALKPVVDGVLGSIQRAATEIALRAKRLIDTAVTSARTWLNSLTQFVTRQLILARAAADAMFAALRQKIDAAVAKLATLKDYLVKQAMAFLSRAIRAALEPIYRRALQHLMDLIGPEVQAAVERAKLMFPNGMPPPPTVSAAQVTAGAQASSSILSEVKKGLLNPEGDHFGIGITLGGTAAALGGASGAAGATLDIVMDYRRNDVGFFLSPQAGGQLNFGAVEGTGNLSGVGAWGTVASFGKPTDDVLAGYGGMFTNVNYGAQLGLAAEAGIAVSSGGAFYRGGSIDLDPPLVSFSPLGADSHTVPGATHPGTPVPGTPQTTNTLDLGEVHFERQQSNASSAPGGSSAIDSAVQVVRNVPTKDPSANVLGISVVGETSRIWVSPSPGKSREQENADLATARALSVKAGLDGRLGGQPTVNAHGAGDRRARSEGKPEKDATPSDQRALMFADVSLAGTADTTSPPTKDPDKQEKDKFDVKAGLPNPFTSARTAYGWDTTAGVTGQVGAGVDLGGYVGAGISYSLPIGKTHVAAKTMDAIRQGFGVVKLLLDFMSLSPLGLIRDIIALARVNVASDAEAELAKGVTQHVVSVPPGAANA